MAAKKRNYNETFIKFGFTCLTVNGDDIPQCVICHQTLAKESMKPSKLERHLHKMHPEYKDKDSDFFASKCKTLQHMKLDSTGGFNLEHEKAVEASYHIAMLIAKNKKPHTIAEDLIKPCIVAIGNIMLDTAINSKLKKIPFSNNTIKRRIDDMAENIQKQLIQKLNNSPFISLQCDETTDVSHASQLLFYCRYIAEDKINEELLFIKSLTKTSKGTDIFEALSQFLKEHNISWNKIVGICTDGAPSMMGSRSGFLKLAKDMNENIIASHCVIHRQALAAKTLPDDLKNALQTTIDVVNFIKTSALRTRVFEALCVDLNAEQTKLLFHTEVRWLSKGNMIKRLYELKAEVEVFLLSEGNENLYKRFTNKNFIFYFAYLTDFFELLNNLNLKLQGKQINILVAYDAISAFMSKILLWKSRICLPTSKYFSFPHLNEALDSADFEDANLKAVIIKHLDTLHDEFNRYFPEFKSESWQKKLLRNPFNMRIVDIPKSMQEEIIELKCNSFAKDDFKSMDLETFWLKYYKVYPMAGNEAIKLLMQFSSTYLCETSFSALLCMKTKTRSALNVENDMRCALSNISPNIKELVKEKQCRRL